MEIYTRLVSQISANAVIELDLYAATIDKQGAHILFLANPSFDYAHALSLFDKVGIGDYIANNCQNIMMDILYLQERYAIVSVDVNIYDRRYKFIYKCYDEK